MENEQKQMRASGPRAHHPITAGRLLAGVFLLGGLAASVILLLDHFGSVSLPGCGPDSGCAAAAASAWARMPVVGWPMSLLGVAYFTASLAGWIAGVPGRGGRIVIRAAALFSAVYLVVIVIGRYECPYCIAVHVGNLCFWALSEVCTRGRGGRWWLAFAPTFAIVLAALVGLDARANADADRESERELGASTRTMIDQSRRTIDVPAAHPFTGRYRSGPSPAPIRIVMFTDYQCPDCLRVDREIRDLLAARSDVSLSIKHFPFCPDCNPHLEQNVHPAACVGAQLAEAAGRLGGEEAFFRAHDWFVDRSGRFSDRDIDRLAEELGVNAEDLRAEMASVEILAAIRADADEAIELGLHYTPMIFINGVELRGWRLEGAVARAVKQLAATNPPALGPEHDRPVGAIEKAVEDWRAEPPVRMPADGHVRAIGPVDAPVRVVLWGDYLEPNTGALDALVRAAVAEGGVRYTFRHYPVDQSVNPAAQVTVHPTAGVAHRAAEGAAVLVGDEAYWRVHAYLVEHGSEFSGAAIGVVAQLIGVTEAELRAAMEQPEVRSAIIEDARAGQRTGLSAVPWVYVNEKWVPRWIVRGEPVIRRILDEAARTGGDPQNSKREAPGG